MCACVQTRVTIRMEDKNNSWKIWWGNEGKRRKERIHKGKSSCLCCFFMSKCQGKARVPSRDRKIFQPWKQEILPSKVLKQNTAQLLFILAALFYKIRPWKAYILTLTRIQARGMANLVAAVCIAWKFLKTSAFHIPSLCTQKSCEFSISAEVRMPKLKYYWIYKIFS